MKEIRDYLHLYLGCEVIWNCGFHSLLGVEGNAVFIHGIIEGRKVVNIQNVRLVLRPLSDITEEEQDYRWNNFINIRVIDQEVVAEEIRWLLSKGFDLFNLIPEGLAISKTQTQEQ